jgi:hypothetical protein
MEIRPTRPSREQSAIPVTKGRANYFLLAMQQAGQQPSTPPPAPSMDNSSTSSPSVAGPPAPAEKRTGPKVLNWTYWTVNGALVGSTVAAAQTLTDCSNCTYVPSTLHRPGLLYGAGLPAATIVMYLGYHLKKNNHRWWYVPAVAFTATNAFLAYHFASNTN